MKTSVRRFVHIKAQVLIVSAINQKLLDTNINTACFQCRTGFGKTLLFYKVFHRYERTSQAYNITHLLLSNTLSELTARINQLVAGHSSLFLATYGQQK